MKAASSDTAEVVAAGGQRSRVAGGTEARVPAFRRLALSPPAGLVVVIALFVCFGITQRSSFTSGQVWINILQEASYTVIAAAFAGIVIISGGLDLSVGSVLAAGAMSSAAVANAGDPAIVAFLVGALIGAGVGLVNGLLINYLSIPPIITTLGTLFGVNSLVVHFSGGSPIGPLPAGFANVGQGKLIGIPYLVWAALAIAIIAYVLLHSTTFGWDVRALGGNREAARSSGIRVRRLSTTVYVLSGAAAAIAGALQAAHLGAGSPDLGTNFELTVIAAAIIGGTSIAGGVGTISGIVLGALLLSILGTGLILLNVDPTLQDLATGVVLIVAAALDQLRRRQMFKISTRRATAAEAIGEGGER